MQFAVLRKGRISAFKSCYTNRDASLCPTIIRTRSESIQELGSADRLHMVSTKRQAFFDLQSSVGNCNLVKRLSRRIQASLF